MDRITVAQLEAAFARFVEANRKAGIRREVSATEWGNTHGAYVLDADRLRMDIGSKLYGNAFRFYYLGVHTGGHYDTDFPGFLGWTKREAYNTLQSLTAGIYATLNAR